MYVGLCKCISVDQCVCFDRFFFITNCVSSTYVGSSSSSSSFAMMSDFASSGSAFIDHHPSANQMCCLTEDGIRCSRIAGNASYSKRIQKTVQQKKLRLMIDNTARHVYICDHHKNLIQRERTCSVKKKRKDSCEDENGTNSNDDSMFMMSFNANNSSSMGNFSRDLCGSDDYPTVDLSTLQMNTLRRFKRHYKVQTKPGINKSQLADSLYDQFRKIQVDEKEIITYFIYMVKCNSNKLDVKGLVTNNTK